MQARTIVAAGVNRRRMLRKGQRESKRTPECEARRAPQAALLAVVGLGGFCIGVLHFNVETRLLVLLIFVGQFYRFKILSIFKEKNYFIWALTAVALIRPVSDGDTSRGFDFVASRYSAGNTDVV
jgi:hypothetical protein